MTDIEKRTLNVPHINNINAEQLTSEFCTYKGRVEHFTTCVIPDIYELHKSQSITFVSIQLN